MTDHEFICQEMDDNLLDLPILLNHERIVQPRMGSETFREIFQKFFRCMLREMGIEFVVGVSWELDF